MTSSTLQRLTAWISLLLILVTASTPARGFVLCIEADGCVRVELKTPDAACSGCDDHDESAASNVADSNADVDGDCPCIDLAVPGTRHDQRAQPRVYELHASVWFAPTRAVVVAQWTSIAEPVRGPPLGVPRVAETLGHIRSVVLLV